MKIFKSKKWIAATLALGVFGGILSPVSAFAAQSANAGESGYVSLHQYVSKTDVENVYKITLSVKGTFDPNSRTEVAVVMDNSQSMNQDNTGGAGHLYDSVPGNNGAAISSWVDHLFGMPGNLLYDDLGTTTSMNSPAYLLRPMSSNYTDFASYRTALSNSDYLWTTDPLGLPSPAGVVNPTNYPADFTASLASNLTASSPRETRLYYATQGLKYAIDTFTNTSNVRAKNTSLGIITFSGPGDSENDPFYNEDWAYPVNGTWTSFEPIGNYGFGSNVLARDGSTMMTAGRYVSGVTYSTRLDTTVGNLSNYDLMMSTNTYGDDFVSLGITAGDPSYDYYQGLADRSNILPEQSTPYSSAGSSTFTEGGLISMQYKDNLLTDASDRIFAASSLAQDTWIYDGLDEAARMFFGHGDQNTIPGIHSWMSPGTVDDAGGVSWGYGNGNAGDIEDDVRRYVVLITDGENTSPDDYPGSGTVTQPDFSYSGIMALATRMKNQGVEFFVIGVDPQGGKPGWDTDDYTQIMANNATYPGDAAADHNAWLALLASQYIYDDEFELPVGTPGYVDSAHNAAPPSYDPANTVVDNAAYSATGGSTALLGGGNYDLTAGVGPAMWDGTLTSWNNIVSAYDSTYVTTTPTFGASQPTTQLTPDDSYSRYIHVDGSDPAAITTAFKTFVDIINRMGEDAKSTFGFTEAAEIYQMPGKPLLDWNEDEVPGQNATYTNGQVSWTATQGIPLNKEMCLSFYVKMQDGLDPSLSYPPLTDVAFNVTGRFAPPAGQPQGKPWKKIKVNDTFPVSYIKGNGAIEQDSTQEEADAANSNTTGTTGAEGHQQNRKDAETTRNYTSALTNATPNITNLSVGTGLSGKAKAIVTVANGSDMRYQWQHKNDAGEWEDIFGATSSQYTLSGKFKAGQEYEMRCKITNDAGSIHYSEVLKITATDANKGEGLQTK